MSEVDKFKSGDKVEGTVTRITPFGAFVQISPAVEALVHVSELGDGDNVDPEKVFTLNERKEFVVLEIEKENRKISLSLNTTAKPKTKTKDDTKTEKKPAAKTKAATKAKKAEK